MGYDDYDWQEDRRDVVKAASALPKVLRSADPTLHVEGVDAGLVPENYALEARTRSDGRGLSSLCRREPSAQPVAFNRGMENKRTSRLDPCMNDDLLDVGKQTFPDETSGGGNSPVPRDEMAMKVQVVVGLGGYETRF
uniref:Uncharacterized protein n=1 Tax=Mycena chlorophos TaxID=658473 RepID=A0ABQ0KW90_MYCCL|nr:predicted protein [Mycena chlorophos]